MGMKGYVDFRLCFIKPTSGSHFMQKPSEPICYILPFEQKYTNSTEQEVPPAKFSLSSGTSSETRVTATRAERADKPAVKGEIFWFQLELSEPNYFHRLIRNAARFPSPACCLSLLETY